MSPDIQCTYKTKDGKIVTVNLPWQLDEKVTTHKLPEGATFLSSIPPNFIPLKLNKKVKWFRQVK